MKNNLAPFYATWILGIITGLMLGILFIFIYIDPYKQGQIDALTGNVKYELVVNSDSTKSWKSNKK